MYVSYMCIYLFAYEQGSVDFFLNVLSYMGWVAIHGFVMLIRGIYIWSTSVRTTSCSTSVKSALVLIIPYRHIGDKL